VALRRPLLECRSGFRSQVVQSVRPDQLKPFWIFVFSPAHDQGPWSVLLLGPEFSCWHNLRSLTFSTGSSMCSDSVRACTHPRRVFFSCSRSSSRVGFNFCSLKILLLTDFVSARFKQAPFAHFRVLCSSILDALILCFDSVLLLEVLCGLLQLEASVILEVPDQKDKVF
jgi:hypothetical protein